MAGSRSQFSFSLYDGESVQGSLESMRQSRANESKLLRRASDRQSKPWKRANETEQETVERRASVRLKGEQMKVDC